MPEILSRADSRAVFSRAGLNEHEAVVATFRIVPEGTATVQDVAALLAVNTSLGTLSALPWETRAERDRVMARVLSASPSGEVRLAFPRDTWGHECDITRILGLLWYSAEYSHCKSIWLEDVEVPATLLAHFRGPRLGLAGIRAACGNQKGPLLGVIVKPRGGSSLPAIQGAVEAALRGGADYVIDDELACNPSHTAFTARVQCLMSAVIRASRSTGKQKAYIATITANLGRAIEYAKTATRLGARGVLVNAYTMGLGSLEYIAESLPPDCFLISSNMGTGIFSRSPTQTGMSDLAVMKLCRIAGADALHTGIISSTWYANDIPASALASLRDSAGGMRPAAPIVAGALNVGNVCDNLRVYGHDAMYQCGVGILGYPTGPENGAASMRRLLLDVSPDLSVAAMQTQIVALSGKHPALKLGLEQLGWKGMPVP